MQSVTASLLAEVRQHPSCCEAGSHECQDQTETVSQDLILALLHCCFEGISFPAAITQASQRVLQSIFRDRYGALAGNARAIRAA